MPVSRQAELFGWEERGHVFELDAIPDIFGRQSVDVGDVHQREVFLPLLGGPDGAGDRVAGFQSEELDLRGRDVDVVRRVQVVVVGRAQESVAVGHDFEHSLTGDLSGKIIFGDHLLNGLCGRLPRSRSVGDGLTRGPLRRFVLRCGFRRFDACCRLRLQLLAGLAPPLLGSRSCRFGHALLTGRFRFRLCRCLRGRSSGCRCGLSQSRAAASFGRCRGRSCGLVSVGVSTCPVPV